MLLVARRSLCTVGRGTSYAEKEEEVMGEVLSLPCSLNARSHSFN